MIPLLIAVLALIGAIWLGQRRLIYFPSTDSPDRARSGLTNLQEVSFTTADSVSLHAWFVPPSVAPSGFTAIIFNGNAGHRGHRAGLAAELTARGLACLLVDYRGYGGNPGTPTETGLAEDARAVHAYLAGRPDVDPRRLVYIGESLGTPVAIRLATEHPPAALVLRSPFTSLADIGRVHYPWLPVGWILRDRYPAADLIRHVRAPILVIAGTADGVIPFENSLRLFEAAPEPKRLMRIEGADHNDAVLVHGAPMVNGIIEFLAIR